MTNLQLVVFLIEGFRYHVHHSELLAISVELGPPSIENGAVSTENLLLNTQVTEHFP